MPSISVLAAQHIVTELQNQPELMKPEFLVAAAALFISTVVALAALWVSRMATRNDYLFEVKAWSDRLSELAGEILAQIDLVGGPDPDELVKIAAKISAHVDIGRLWFPNNPGATFGGLRHPATDAALLLHELCIAMRYAMPTPMLRTAVGAAPPYPANFRHAVVNLRRRFCELAWEATNFKRACWTLSRQFKKIDGLECGPLWTATEKLLPPITKGLTPAGPSGPARVGKLVLSAPNPLP